MTGIYRYSIIRFRPFAETGEFANIGVLVTEVGDGETAFKLAPVRFGRVKHFFEGIGYEAYRNANHYLRKELERVSKELPLLSTDKDREIFFSVARARESSVIFSPPRLTKFNESLQDLVSVLYNRYIGRNFESSENPESNLTKRLRSLLHGRGIKHFKSVRVDDDVVPIIFPLGHKNSEIFAIKPLSFSQKTPLSVFDHGASWKKRLEYLLEKEKIRPRNILMTLEPPRNQQDDSFRHAFEEVKDDLRELPFEFVTTSDGAMLNEALFTFVARAPVRHGVWAVH